MCPATSARALRFAADSYTRAAEQLEAARARSDAGWRGHRRRDLGRRAQPAWGTTQSVAMRVVVMGVSGSGKSTVGALLAAELHCPFADADDLHTAAARAKMAAGQPLDDADRLPWLDLVGQWLAAHEDGVVACSALRRAYRDQLRRHAPDLVLAYLRLSEPELRDRMRARVGHFMPAALLASQLATLEPPAEDEPGRTVDGAQPPERIVADLVELTQR